jgi:hypothetical protein
MARLTPAVTTNPEPITPAERSALDLLTASGWTLADFARAVAALKSSDRRAAYCAWLAAEPRKHVRVGLLAGLAAMEVA